MNDDEFLNDRDCTPTPKGETPRTESALCQLRYYETRNGDRYEEQLTYIEPEFARDLERELARALRVVEAARRHAVNGDSGANLFWHVTEWEAGR